MLVTLLFLPVTWKGALLGFLLFRLFDIVKPFPAAHCERLYGGFGVMMDDLVAGIYGNLSLRLLVPGSCPRHCSAFRRNHEGHDTHEGGFVTFVTIVVESD